MFDTEKMPPTAPVFRRVAFGQGHVLRRGFALFSPRVTTQDLIEDSYPASTCAELVAMTFEYPRSAGIFSERCS